MGPERIHPKTVFCANKEPKGFVVFQATKCEDTYQHPAIYLLNDNQKDVGQLNEYQADT